jgi:allophanate hydrolase
VSRGAAQAIRCAQAIAADARRDADRDLDRPRREGDRVTAAERVAAAYARIAAADRSEVWIALRAQADALADAAALDALDDAARAARPLLGLTLAVSDDVDVAGLPTTAACPAYAYVPSATAPAVQRLVDAGAIVLGKANLDQFGVGRTGTRTPHGAVRDALRPERVAGGAAAGSAVAVALGLADLAVATDADGASRVPAAFGGVVAIKPARAAVPTDGLVPALRGLECLAVLAPDLARAERALAVLAGSDAAAPPEAAAPRVAVPDVAALADLTDAARAAFAAAATRLREAGAELVDVDLAPFLEASRLLDDGALVADRYAAVGEFVDAHPDAVDPAVGALIGAAGDLTATQYLRDADHADALKDQAVAALGAARADALLLPTTTAQPTLAEVAAATDPQDPSRRLGRYAAFATLFDLAAVALPAGTADGGRFGVTLLAATPGDRVPLAVARLLATTAPQGSVA